MSDADQVPGNDDIEINENDGRTFKNKLPNCLKKIIKIIFSTPGLVILVVLYSVMGAFIFPILEAPTGHNRNNMALAKSREDCLRELWTITEKLNVLYEKHWKELIDEQLRRFEGTIVAATRNGAASGTEYNKTTKWSFSEALLYSVTVITTIGHGNLTPKTSGGKIVTIFYALIGVPLMLMCLSSLGGLLAEVLQYSYAKFCCSRNCKKRENCTANNGFRKSVANGGDCHSGSTSCNGKCSDDMDCTTCKYDTLETETKLHNNYEYIAVNERDESCHLLYNSPIKINHSSPLMQITSIGVHQSSPIKQNCTMQQQNDMSQIKQYSNQNQQHNQMNKFNHLYHQYHPHHHQVQLSSPQHYQLTLPKNYRIKTAAVGTVTGTTTTTTPNTEGSTTTLSETIGDSTATIGSTISMGGNINAAGGISSNLCTSPSTTTTTVYIPVATTNPMNNQYVSNTLHCREQQQQQQQLVKYHTIQLQQHHNTNNLTATNAVSNIKNFDHSITGQTSATVHGFRRGKFIPKPLPHEINMLLAESDLSSSTTSNRNDLLTSNSPNSSTCNLGITLVNEQTSNYSGNTGGIVDIMEDEEESDQSHSISLSFLHGTPSKIPLLSQSSSGPGTPSHRNNIIGIELEEKSNSVENKCYNSKNLNYDKNQENGCLHNNSIITNFKQKNKQEQTNQQENSIYDNDDDNDNNHHYHHHYHLHNQEQQQVPITIVLFILTGYIFLGTVIFAFWENWSFIDGAYFCFVTLSTIGYGDFLPLHTFHHGPDVQLFACCIYLLIGLVLVAMSFSILETKLMWKCKRIAVRLKLAKD